MIKKAIDRYLADIQRIFSSGDAREESYYSKLEWLMEKMWKINYQGVPSIIVTPKSREAVKPDFVIKDDQGGIAGYIEAKAPMKNLDSVTNSAQIKRYNKVFDNLLVTNFLEFHHYREGRLIKSIKLAEPEDLTKPGLRSFLKAREIRAFFKEFLLIHDKPSMDYIAVAEELAHQTRIVRDEVAMPELSKSVDDDFESTQYTSHLQELLTVVKKILLHGLSKEEFADLYSQTLTFGIFIASISHDGLRDVRLVSKYIPITSGVLDDLFHIFEKKIAPSRLEDCLQYILDIINKARPKMGNFETHLRNIGNSIYIKNKNLITHPIIHFYETFLKAYDPRLRQKKGVYYTPEPIVNFVVNSVNMILKEKLKKKDGLADQNIKILDPAAGTGTFLASVTNLASEEYRNNYGEGGVAEMVKTYLLNNLFAFESMMAPYAVGHWRMEKMLKHMGVQMTENNRFKLLITNTLEMNDVDQPSFEGMGHIAKESIRADNVKTREQLTVVLGNPPYAGHSSNPARTKGKDSETWIGHLIEDYKKIDGQPLGEKNAKWLQDDYVKFIRFAQHMIDKNGLDEGVIGFVTNHAYLDNPTFRGMRHSLMKSFDEIYILDLHGNKAKKEKTPDGSRDENVFDIRQGVAISLFIKIKGEHKGCRVFHAHVYGSRKFKYDTLDWNDFRSIQWQEIFPDPEFFLFTPGGKMDRKHYSTFVKITDIFPAYNVGIVTARDKLTIKNSREEIWSAVNRFAACEDSEARSLFQLGPDSRDWQVKEARQDILSSGPDKKRIARILYRPFDFRYTYYTGKSRGFLCMPRPDIMPHMLKENIGLITVRQVAEGVFNHCLITENIIESRVTTSNKGIAYLFPLYLYLFPSSGADTGGHPNLEPRFLKQLAEITGFSSRPNPIDVFYYVYAILFSNRYRESYAEGLKIDFPRIPLPPSFELFMDMAKCGEELCGLHKMPLDPGDSGSRFEATGSNLVKKVSYKAAEQKVFINSSQYFSNVEPDSWDYRLCGYQVLKKWLSMRKNQVLIGEEITGYLKIIHIIHFTRQLQDKIDSLYPHIDRQKPLP